MINYQKVIIFTQILFICWDYVAYLLGLKISILRFEQPKKYQNNSKWIFISTLRQTILLLSVNGFGVGKNAFIFQNIRFQIN